MKIQKKAVFTKDALVNIMHACMSFGECWVCSDGQMYQNEADCMRHVRFRQDQNCSVLFCRCTEADCPTSGENLWERFYDYAIEESLPEAVAPAGPSREEALRRFEERAKKSGAKAPVDRKSAEETPENLAAELGAGEETPKASRGRKKAEQV